MPPAGQSNRLPRLSDAERAEVLEEQRILARARRRQRDDEPWDELEAALAAPWRHGPKAGRDSYGRPVEGAHSVITIRRTAGVAAMSRRRAQPRTPNISALAPMLRPPDPAEQAAEEERRLPPPGAARFPKATPYAPGAAVEYKPQSGAGGWRRGKVSSDDGGRELFVTPSSGGPAAPVWRSRVRLPREKPEPQPVARVAPPPSQPEPRVVGTGKSRRVGPRPRGRIRDGDYLSFVRRKPCLSCGGRPVDAHHFGPRAVGRKTDDYRTVPLCRRCHDHLHSTGVLLGDPEREAPYLLVCKQVDLLVTYFAPDDGAHERLVACLDEAGP